MENVIIEKPAFGKSVILGYIAAILAAALFGSISTVAKPTLSNINPLLLSSFVYLLASLTLTPIAHSKKNNPVTSIDRKNWLLILAIATSGAIIAPSLFFIGLVDSKASDTAILSNAEVIFTVLIAITFFKEKFKPIGYLAIALVISGTIIVTANLDFSSLSLPDFGKNKGNLLILASMAFWAVDNNLSKLASEKIMVPRLVQLKGLIGGSVLLLFVVLGGLPNNIAFENLPNVLLLGIGGVGASLFFFLHSLKRIGTVRTMLIYSTSSIFGLFFAAIFLKENIGTYQIIAVSIMLFGIYLVENTGQKNPKQA